MNCNWSKESCLDVPYNQSCGKNELGPRYQNLDTIKKTFRSLSFMVKVVESWLLNSCHLPPGSCSEEARHISTSSPEWTWLFRACGQHCMPLACQHYWVGGVLCGMWANGCWFMSIWAPQQWRYCKVPFHCNQVWSYSLDHCKFAMIKRVDLEICGSCLVDRPVLWSLPPLLGWHLCYWMELVNKWLAFGTVACKYIAMHWLGLALWGRSWASSQIPCLKFI
jgi:hypothetical protein